MQTVSAAEEADVAIDIATDADTDTSSTPDYEQLQLQIVNAQAKFSAVIEALSDTDVVRLVNTTHMMHSMRWQRASMRLLLALWHGKPAAANLDKRLDGISWELFSRPPARLALASTLLRIHTSESKERNEYLRYLLAHKYDEHEFHRAQVVVALGLNRNPKDIDYLVEMANSDNRYLIQSAVTSLGLMQDQKAQKALGKLWYKHRDTPLQELIEGVLARVYRVVPNVKSEAKQEIEDSGKEEKELHTKDDISRS